MGTQARRLKRTARGATVVKIAEDVRMTEATHRDRKQKRRLKEAEGFGRKWRTEEAESGKPHESDQGLGPGQGTQTESSDSVG